MKIFILEDDPWRIRLFREWLFGHDLTFADSCQQEDRFLGNYDIVFMDHDLGGRQLEDHEDCGATFARIIRERIGPAEVIIHSYNAEGAKNIQSIIGGYLAPFGGKLFNLYVEQINRRLPPATAP